MLDFPGLQERYLERDLEDAILRDPERCLLKLGAAAAHPAARARLEARPAADD